ncbi:amino acid adenylation domain-containing protein [Nocardia tengchongensis]|uniref:Amino acid adenylation domain-containing protein n=1 Tax=Nocardia tengchongensis TaxID=2055889 RepID=A0ABX8CWG4_9NOCA|nr:non-ribosomal peptide synthetase [Nocardia tengchongensis]QVI24247.1 amino acid adenylation domain-containing protein [Nocardia tengchongensis]
MSGSIRYPLTAYQRDIWTAAEIYAGQPAYLSCAVWHLTIALDEVEMMAAIERTWTRTDGVRMRYGVVDGIPYQELSPDRRPPVRLIDVTGADDPEAEAQCRIRALTGSAIDLDGPEPFRLIMIRAAAESYYLVVTAHHLTVDATGLRILGAQIMTDYTVTTKTGTPPELSSASFVECLALESAYRASEQYRIDRDAVVPRLCSVTPALFDPRHGTDGVGSVTASTFELDRALVNRIRAAGISLYPYLLAMLGIYLSRVLRAEQITIGIPFGNRNNPAEDAAVGNFANTIPVVLDIGTYATVAELVSAVKADVRQLKQHQRYPLGDLVGELRRAGIPARQLFDVTVAYARSPANRVRFEGFEHVGMPSQGHSPLAMAWSIVEVDDDGPLLVRLDHSAAIFDADYSIDAVFAQVATLLNAGVDALDTDPALLPMLSAAEHDRLVDRVRATARPYENRTSVIAAILRQAERTPDAVAVRTAPGDTLTYRELIHQAVALAGMLRESGIGTGDLVAVLLERGPQLLVATLAAMYVGAAYVPVDPGYPAERVAFLLADSAAAVVLTDTVHAARLAPEAPAALTTDRWPVGRPATEVPPAPAGTDLAYVIYTSGSTGLPKGVAVEHHSVINRLAWMQRRYPLNPSDVILQKTPSSFDVSVWELFWWGFVGAQVALLKPGGEKDPYEILTAIHDFGVTVLHFVPTMLTPFVELLESDPAAVSRVASLHTVFCSGEALLPHQVSRWNRVFASLGTGAPRLVNLYGPTEATVDVSFHDCPTDPAQPVHRVPLGRAIDNTRLYVLGPADQPQPVGVAGELCIAGAGLARGYSNHPELDAEKFIADPFHPGERMYRTGDLARWLADGELEYLGRIDRQVKIRGNRVELGEVENALAAVPGITAAAVIDLHSPTRGSYLAAYYVPGSELEPATLRTELSRKLPDFMMPAQFVEIDAIPLTPSGKTDRAALGAIRHTPEPTTLGAARTWVEEQLVTLWSEVLGRGSVALTDNFYDLGGDSILLVRIRARAAARGLRFSARELAESPTIAELADRVHIDAVTATAVAPFELVAAIDRAQLGHVVDAYPLTKLQLGMLFHSRERAESPLYHDVFRYSLRMDWDEAALRAAVTQAIARHPMLRTSFDLAAYSEPLQLVHDRLEPPMTVIDLRAAAPRTGDALLREHVAQHHHRRYAFERPGLFHLAVFLFTDRIDLVLSFHHAILDGWSVATLMSELLTDYRAVATSAPPRPAVELPSFAEYVRAERNAIADPADRQYWSELLAGAESSRIRPMTPHISPTPGREQASTGTRRSVSIPVPAATAGRAERLAATLRMSVKTVLLAAHLCTVGLFAGRSDITTGVVTHGRPELLDAEHTLGLFLNTMPFRLDISGRTWREVLVALAEQDRNGLSHIRFPLVEIQRETGIQLDTFFNYVHFHGFEATLQDLDVDLLGIDIREVTNFALSVAVAHNPLDGNLLLRIDGEPAFYTGDQLTSIGHTYLSVLALLTDDPSGPGDFGSLAPAPPRIGDVPGTVLELFDACAARVPTSVALEFGSRTVTYAALAELSGRIAGALVARGARPGDRIALAVGRSPELVAAVLGIAKAGAACVPLDPSYPKPRLHAMLDQARPFLVITGSGHEPLVPQQYSRIDMDDLMGSATSADLPPVDPSTTAYVLFTSGSTGDPKGVAMPHRALANLIGWQLSVPSGRLAETGLAPATTQFAPLSFDVSFQEIYSTLCGGGRLILLTEDQRHDLPALPGLLSDTDAERVFLPYVALQQLAEAAARLGTAPAGLRVIISSGEQLRVTDEIRALCAAGTKVILENQYGPTETHVATSYTMTGDPARFPALPPIGTAIDNAEILILDERLRPVPDGVPGEIHLGGLGLADGYENRPDLTDAVFAPHPQAAGARLYRTGDIGRRLPNGEVVSDGRLGGQVKIRGHRVEPMEVELALRRVTAALVGVTEVAVVARGGGRSSSAQSQLVACLVGSRSDGDEKGIIAALREWLPDYMIPGRLVWLDTLPLTPSGKRDDAALIAMELPSPDTSETVAPRTAAETVLVAMLAEALGLPEVGIHDDSSLSVVLRSPPCG